MNRKFHFTRATRKSIVDYVFNRKPAEPEKPSAPVDNGFLCAALTDKGKVRPTNQDALVISDELRIYGVADGMGGHKGGETASAGCRDTVLSALAGKTPALENISAAVDQANEVLFHQQETDPNLTGMGTTLSLMWMSDAFVYMAHVGDSRIYCLRDGALQQMTDDHSLVAELVRRGALTPEQAENHPMRNVITRAVGTDVKVEADLAVEERRAGDVWLVCSDGLHGLVSDEQMADVLREHAPAEAATLLMEAAMNAGAHDNVSIVVLLDKEGAK